jgi:thymidine phosphorylase
MLIVGGVARKPSDARAMLEKTLADGSALEVFRRMVEAQGGDARVADDSKWLPRSRHQAVVTSTKAGYVSAIDPYALGLLAIEIGAGRTRAEDRIDAAAGFEVLAPIGTRVSRGTPLLRVHARSAELAESVQLRVREAFSLRERSPRRHALVLERLH